jgi:hypothetical protein
MDNNFLDFCKYSAKILIGGKYAIFKLKKRSIYYNRICRVFNFQPMNFSLPLMRGGPSMIANNKIELHVPSIMGFERVAMKCAATVAKKMGFTEDRDEKR